MAKYQAMVSMPGSPMRRVVIEVGDYDGVFGAKELLEAQYPGASIHNVMRLDEPRASRRTSDSGTGSAEALGAAGGTIGVVLALLWVTVRFAPLLAFFGALGYWEWSVTSQWHPVLRVLAIAASLVLLRAVLVLGVAFVPRALMAALGAVGYFAAGLAAKHLELYPAAVDWIWAVTISAGLGALGWWSLASCHDILMRWSPLKEEPADDGD